MHRMHNHGCDRDPRFFGGKFRGGRGGGLGGFGRAFGRGGGMGDFLRAGRMLADGDLRLIVLALLVEAPRHGYDIIKELEQRSSGVYSPSPGVVYPTLTYLEEVGYATSTAEGNKKVYAITDAGRQHLSENREFVDSVLGQMEAVGRKMAQAREWFEGLKSREQEAEPTTGPAADLYDARRSLRRALAEIEGAPDDRLTRAADVLRRAAADIRNLG